jgi:CelD/BcsL family acetyltransferase involved in cellulose biosynthesis
MTPLTTAFERFTDLAGFTIGRQAENSPVRQQNRAGRPEILLSVHEDIEPLKEVWQVLERDGDGTPFQSYLWVSAWQRHIGTKQGIRPAIVVGWDNEGGALFIFPLGVQRGFVCNKLVWLGGDITDYQGPLLARDFVWHVSPAQFPNLWADIREMLPIHHMAALSRMPERIGGQANPFMTLGGLRRHASSAHCTVLKEDWATYYNEKRSSGSKKRDKQKRRKLEELGEVSFITPATAEERVACFDALAKQKSVAFARMGVANFFEKPGHLDFYRDLATNPEAEELFHLSHMRVGDTVAATSCGLSFGGRYHYILAAYDETAETARFSPGMAQLMELMAHATEEGHTVFDFTIGDEAYKEQWCELEVPLYDHFEPDTFASWAVLGPKIAYLRAKRFIKQTPVLWQGFTRLRAAFGGFFSAHTARA